MRIKDERRQQEGKEDGGRGNKVVGKTQIKRKRLCIKYDEGEKKEGGRGGGQQQ